MLQENSNNYQEKITRLVSLLSSSISPGSDETNSSIENILIEIFSSMQTESVLITTFIEQLLIQFSAQRFLKLFAIIDRHDQLQQYAEKIRFSLQDIKKYKAIYWKVYTERTKQNSVHDSFSDQLPFFLFCISGIEVSRISHYISAHQAHQFLRFIATPDSVFKLLVNHHLDQKSYFYAALIELYITHENYIFEHYFQFSPYSFNVMHEKLAVGLIQINLTSEQVISWPNVYDKLLVTRFIDFNKIVKQLLSQAGEHINSHNLLVNINNQLDGCMQLKSYALDNKDKNSQKLLKALELDIFTQVLEAYCSIVVSNSFNETHKQQFTQTIARYFNLFSHLRSPSNTELHIDLAVRCELLLGPFKRRSKKPGDYKQKIIEHAQPIVRAYSNKIKFFCNLINLLEDFTVKFQLVQAILRSKYVVGLNVANLSKLIKAVGCNHPMLTMVFTLKQAKNDFIAESYFFHSLSDELFSDTNLATHTELNDIPDLALIKTVLNGNLQWISLVAKQLDYYDIFFWLQSNESDKWTFQSSPLKPVKEFLKDDDGGCKSSSKISQQASQLLSLFIQAATKIRFGESSSMYGAKPDGKRLIFCLFAISVILMKEQGFVYPIINFDAENKKINVIDYAMCEASSQLALNQKKLSADNVEAHSIEGDIPLIRMSIAENPASFCHQLSTSPSVGPHAMLSLTPSSSGDGS